MLLRGLPSSSPPGVVAIAEVNEPVGDAARECTSSSTSEVTGVSNANRSRVLLRCGAFDLKEVRGVEVREEEESKLPCRE